MKNKRRVLAIVIILMIIHYLGACKMMGTDNGLVDNEPVSETSQNEMSEETNDLIELDFIRIQEGMADKTYLSVNADNELNIINTYIKYKEEIVYMEADESDGPFQLLIEDCPEDELFTIFIEAVNKDTNETVNKEFSNCFIPNNSEISPECEILIMMNNIENSFDFSRLELFMLYAHQQKFDLSLIKDMSTLRYVDLASCEEVQCERDDLLNLVNIKTLKLSNAKLDVDIESMARLERLELYNCDFINAYFEDIDELVELKELKIVNCSNANIAKSLIYSKSLKGLEVINSTDLEIDIERLNELVELEYLYLVRCSIISDDEVQIEGLNKLKQLELAGIYGEFSPNFINSLESIEWLKLIDIDVEMVDISNLKNLEYLYAYFLNTKCMDIQTLGNLENLNTLDLYNVSGELESLGGLKQLSYLKLYNCDELYGDVEDLNGLNKLEYLEISLCDSIIELGDISNLINLNSLKLDGNNQLDGDIKFLEKLINLEDLSLNFLNNVSGDLYSMKNLSKLKDLSLKGCINISGDISILEDMNELELIIFESQREVYGDISVFNNTESLKFLYLINCPNISGSIDEVQSLPKLRILELDNMTIEGNISSLCNHYKLERVWLDKCEDIYGDIGVLTKLENLKSLYISECPNVFGSVTLNNGDVVVCYIE